MYTYKYVPPLKNIIYSLILILVSSYASAQTISGPSTVFINENFILNLSASPDSSVLTETELQIKSTADFSAFAKFSSTSTSYTHRLNEVGQYQFRMRFNGFFLGTVIHTEWSAPITIDAKAAYNGKILTEKQKLLSQSNLRQNFGWVVDIDGDLAVVGAAMATAAHHGSAYVYTRTQGKWMRTATLSASDAAANRHFGRQVAISGNTIIIGNHGIRGKDDHGEAYIYTLTGGKWVETKLTPSVASIPSELVKGIGFGGSVAIDGNTALVGAFNGRGTYVFTRSANTWRETTIISAMDQTDRDHSGVTSVAIVGNTALIGTAQDPVDFKITGAAFIFTRSGNSWTEVIKLKSGDNNVVSFGREVALDGGNAVVGGSSTNPNGLDPVYVYSRNTGWSQTAKLQSSANVDENLGHNGIAIENDTILLGAPNAGSRSGTGYIFKLTQGIWKEVAKFTSSDGSSTLLGYDVAISNGTIFVGGHEEVHIYNLNQL